MICRYVRRFPVYGQDFPFLLAMRHSSSSKAVISKMIHLDRQVRQASGEPPWPPPFTRGPSMPPRHHLHLTIETRVCGLPILAAFSQSHQFGYNGASVIDMQLKGTQDSAT